MEDSASDLSREWDREHDRHVLTKLLAIVQPDFDAQTWQAFTRFALDSASAAAVARELAISARRSCRLNSASSSGYVKKNAA